MFIYKTYLFYIFNPFLKAYIAAKPKKGCNLAWGCWVLFALTIYQIILLIIHFLDKPNGFVRYESGNLIKDEPKPLKRAATGGATPTKPVTHSSSSSSTAAAPAPAPAPKKKAAPPAMPPRGQGASKPKPELPKRGGGGGASKRRKLVAVYDCEAEQDGDLAFRKGDVIYFVSNEPGDGWITGEINGVRGVFPENYVQDA